MKISWTTLQSFFNKNIPQANKLEVIFTFGAFEVEGVENVEVKVGKKIHKDTVIDLKVLPDRACYALSWQGIAYELSALTSIPLANKAFDFTSTKIKIGDQSLGDIGTGRNVDRDVVIKVDPNSDCNRQLGQYITGIDWRSSPDWLAAELNAVGQRSISAIVDITNYVMLYTGQPLHAFDADKVEGNIRIRKATTGEAITLLDGSTKVLDETVTVIADDVGALDVAGVKGGKKAEVDANTKNIIMVASSFDPVSIRKASNKVGIKNDASKRFENAVPQQLSGAALDFAGRIVAQIFTDARFGKITDVVVNPEPSVMTIDVGLESINAALGTKLSVEEVAAPLLSLDFEVKEDGKKFSVTAPFWRRDVTIPEDIYEEIGRVIGYDKIVPTLPVKVTPNKVNPTYYVSEWIKNLLVARGFSEVILYTLGNEGFYETVHPVASDKAFLRSNLSKHMKVCLENNARHIDYLGLDDIMIFEIGRVFDNPVKNKEKKEEDNNSSSSENDGESLHLAIAIHMSKQTKKRTGLSPSDLIIKTLAEVGKEIGHELQGQVSSKDMQAWAEVSLDGAIEKSTSLPSDYSALGLSRAADINYTKISPYPYAIRDVAFFVQESDKVTSENTNSSNEQSVKELTELIRSHAGKNLVNIRLFDVFTKAEETKTPGDAGVTVITKKYKTSYAFRLIFQSYEKTLSEDEISSAMDSVYKALKNKGYEIR